MRVRLKGLNRVRKRLADGKWVEYYYLGKGGPRIMGEPGSPDFIASYNEAARSSRRPSRDDLQSLVDRYLRSSAFMDRKPKTKKTYLYHIKWIERDFGDLPISALREKGIRREFFEWRENIGRRSPRQADLAFRTLARIISWAVDQELAPANPCEKAGKLYSGSRRDNVWTREQEAAFMEKAPKHLHLALQLALWTGQRQGDLLELTWSAYEGSCIRLQQSKTGARVSIPVARDLKIALEARRSEVGQMFSEKADLSTQTILTTTAGTRWTEHGFRGTWRKACEAAGVAGVTFNDLRGTAVTRLALAGCSVPEIASITGHSLRDVADILDSHYLSRDPELAKSAIRKLELNQKRPN